MTRAEPTEEAAPPAGATLPARGHVIAAAGPGEDEAPAVAVWHVSVEGTLAGAWVLPATDAGDPTGEAAARLLLLAERRAPAGFTAAHTLDPLHAAARRLGVALPASYDSCFVDLTQLREEIRAEREHLQAAIAAHASRTTSKLQPLTWASEIPAELSSAPLAALAALRLAAPQGPPAVVAALAAARVLRWHIRQWQDTESARLRREYLRGDGVARPLPPGWSQRLTHAHTLTFPQPAASTPA